MFEIEGQEYGMKPMNCPGHCLIFDHTLRSYKDLPLRISEFGVLHRNELSGALTGLTRVRRFVQDDCHIFCRKDQIESEVNGCLDFLDYIYRLLGFNYELELSTRPESGLGSKELWEIAENQLSKSLDKLGKPWKINPGDGAFYGPKIDIKVYDALKRKHQCGTIQLDFNLPKRFNLQYKTGTPDKESENEIIEYPDMIEQHVKVGFERPVIIHRAVLGSLERMIAILTEQTGGKWPFWLNPKQVALLPVSELHLDFANRVKNRLLLEGFFAEVDTASLTLNKKIRNAQIEQFSYIAVIGHDEVEAKTVDVRDRDTNASLGKMKISEFVAFLNQQMPKPSEARVKLEGEAFFEEEVKVVTSLSLPLLNETLERNTFIAGNQVSAEDWKVFTSIKKLNAEKYPHVARWFNHLKSIS
jgi:threonyl-tRNA synthetase